MTDARPIIVGYDGRAGSHAALAEAVRLAEGLGAPLVIVFSWHVSPAGGEVQDLGAAVEERGRAVLAEALTRVEGSGVAVATEMLAMPPADGLIEAADSRDAQMIVVGSTGEGPLRGILVGSTSYKLLHLSARPVLVVRASG
jgi:nucleotide-binding universal stress UspA family protein